MRDEVKVNIVLPERSEDALSEGLRMITRKLLDDGHEWQGGILGGHDGYGVEYENVVFMMHPYCWCEREDCVWCAGCQVERPDPVHSDDCYRSKLKALKRKYGKREPWGWHVRWSHPEYGKARTKLCKSMGLDPRNGCEIHCTCGAQDRWQAELDACTCDFCKATGRWAEAGAEPKRGAPNFWHYPSGLKVWWYKWIGRSMEWVTPENVVVEKVVAECLKSINRD